MYGIFTYLWLILYRCVYIYIPYMDPMGKDYQLWAVKITLSVSPTSPECQANLHFNKLCPTVIKGRAVKNCLKPQSALTQPNNHKITVWTWLNIQSTECLIRRLGISWVSTKRKNNNIIYIYIICIFYIYACIYKYYIYCLFCKLYIILYI